MRQLIFLLIVVLSAGSIHAIKDPYGNFISGSSITPTATVQADDVEYGTMNTTNASTWTFDNHQAYGYAEVRFTHSDATIVNDKHYQFVLDIKYETYDYNADDFQTHTIEDVKLEIEYDAEADAPYNDKDVFKIADAHWVEVTVVDVLDGPGGSSVFPSPGVASNVEVKAGGMVERYYDPNEYNLPEISSIQKNFLSSQNEVQVSWAPVDGAEGYDLEWTYVDNYTLDGSGNLDSIGSANLNYNFGDNSTRVRLMGTSEYDIPMIYGQGFLLYRVRSVWKVGNDYEQVFGGPWHNGPASGVVANWPHKYHIMPDVAHEDSLTWQYNATFAEEGKRKEVVRYFDGTLRERQKVTRLNTDETAVAGESIYDHQGRKAVDILPSPTFENKLRYYERFNLSAVEDSVFGREHFDLDATGNCLSTATALDSTSGAAHYYSSGTSANTRDTTGMTGYIPRAEGYPYTLTRFTRDQTGRPRLETGVGPEFQEGSGHTTRYVYGAPNQEEIDRLFGTEVGPFKHYKKIVKVDPNGQTTVTYKNMAGKTIATALAGGTPENLDGLDKQPDQGAQALTVELAGNNEQKAASLEIRFPMVVSSSGDYDFYYEVTPEAYEDECIPSELCMDCVYELEISVVDECGTELLTAGNSTYKIGTADGLCDDPIEPFVLEGQDMSISNLEVGKYTVIKRLTVVDSAVDKYFEQLKGNSECMNTYNDFFEEEIQDMNMSEQCEPMDGGMDAPDNICEQMYEGMLADMTPKGQYALYDYDKVAGTYSVDTYDLSILNENNDLPDGSAFYENPVGGNYTDANGNAAAKVQYAGGSDYPRNLPLKVFIKNFEESWATDLVAYHPEYCYYEYCVSLNDEGSYAVSSNGFDSLMTKTKTYDEAYDLGLLNPLGLGSTYIPGAIDNGTYSSNNKLDPFFDPSGNWYTPMKDTMQEFIIDGGLSWTMWEAAVKVAVCPKAEDLQDIDICIHYNGFGTDQCLNNKVWRIFRGFYMSLKYRYKEQDRIEQAIENGCYNGCIGNVDFDVSDNIEVINQAFENHPDYDQDQTCHEDREDYFKKKDKRFPGLSDILPAGAIEELDGESSAKAWAGDSMNSKCGEQCAGYADYWMDKLAGCSEYASAQGWAADSQQIRDSLIAVCTAGCDYKNPYGASTAPDKGGYQSFQEVLEGELATSYTKNAECTEDLISMPKPHDQSYSGADSTYPKLDTCACNTITDLKNEFNGLSSYPDGVSDFIEYFAHQTGAYVENLQELNCACESVRDGDGGGYVADANQILADMPHYIPATITCPTCIDCEAFNSAYEDFIVAYGVEEPSETPALFANFLNGSFGFNLTYPEYIEFREACERDYPYIPNDKTQEAKDFIELMRYFASNDMFADNTAYEIGYVSEFYTSSLQKSYSDPSCWVAYMNIYYVNDSLPISDCESPGSNTGGDILKLHIVDTCNNDSIRFDVELSEIFSELSQHDNPEPFTVELNNIDERYNISLDKRCGSVSHCPTHVLRINHPDSSYYFLGQSYNYPMQECITAGDVKLCNEPMVRQITPDKKDCKKQMMEIAERNAQTRYEQYVEEEYGQFRTKYTNFCLSNKSEEFTQSYTSNEYHFTLYYYDRAGNLARTVAPKFVDLLSSSQMTQMENYREAETDGTTPPFQTLLPNHATGTTARTYKYTSFNKVFEQYTPDGDTTEFWYDGKGRLAASQNAKQAQEFLCNGVDCYRYSFTRYDELGRVSQTGQIISEEDPVLDDMDDTNWPYSWGNYEDEITTTRYDAELTSLGLSQDNLRNRVASTSFDDNGDGIYDYATHYSYDPHGNVKEMWQEITDLAGIGQDMKEIEYEYDLVSGNVNKVKYQPGHTDQFFHKYEYDADNRITDVYTSRDGMIWEQDARYKYYMHGPLARTELGDISVQGIDHAYTLQGWIKGVNSNLLHTGKDMGNDSHDGGSNEYFARDAFGYSLGYYEGDYEPINNRNNIGQGSYFLAKTAGTGLDNGSPDLWNGNIRHMVTSIKKLNNGNLPVQAMAYKYDQLNRLVSAHMHRGITNNQWDGSTYQANTYEISELTYDANGNIKTLHRDGKPFVPNMDALTYSYETGTNRLKRVNDYIPDSYYDNDIDGQPSGNYKYDAIGNLVSDDQANIDLIQWFLNGKIKSISRSGGSDPELEFAYGPDGNRVMKVVIPSGEDPDTTYYIRDAQGNIMSTYALRNDSLFLQNQYIYGSERLGSVNNDTLVYSFTPDPDTNRYERMLGEKQYELSNHLGNVLATITDQKMPVEDGSTGNVDYWNSKVVSYSDYYPFGMKMNGRYGSDEEYRFGFNGKESDDEVYGEGNAVSFEYRIHDPRIGRFLSVDPAFKDYPFMSPYVFSGNDPIRFKDVYGLGPGDRVKKAKELVGTSYKQETTPHSLRIGTGATAMKHMDCSELVCRVLADDGQTPIIQLKNTEGLKQMFSNSDKWHKSNKPKVGDVFLWRTSNKGHTGIVTGVNEDGSVEITHAKGEDYGTVTEEYNLDYFTGHEGWQGFFRPMSETMDAPRIKSLQVEIEIEEKKMGIAEDMVDLYKSRIENQDLPDDHYYHDRMDFYQNTVDEASANIEQKQSEIEEVE